jgi:hypothetical protein
VFVATVGMTGACSSTVPMSEVPERYPKFVNPQDASGNTIYKAQDGSCYVTQPFEEPPSSAGVPPPTKTIPCPASMQSDVWAQCVRGDILSNEAGTSCGCDSSGNPPPPSIPKISCPD